MDDHVRLIYAGEVLEGFGRESVKRKLGQWLKLEAAKLDAMFTGRPVVIKRSVPMADAVNWVSRFARLGALLQMEPIATSAKESTKDSTKARSAYPSFEPTQPFLAHPGQEYLPRSGGLVLPLKGPTAAELAELAEMTARQGPATDFPQTRPLDWDSTFGSTDTKSGLFFGSQERSADGRPKEPPPPWAQQRATGAPSAPAPFERQPTEPEFEASYITSLGGLQMPSLVSDVPTVTCPNCGEVQPQTVICRQCTTHIPQALAAKEEQRAQARERWIAQVRAKHGRTPKFGTGDDEQDGHGLGTDADAAALFSLSFAGRLGRMSYLAGGLVFWSGLCLILLLAMLLQNLVGYMLFGAGLLGLLFWSARLTALRLHDIGRSGWWSLLLMVPTVGTIASLVVMLIPGDKNANDYGEPVPERHAWLAIASVVVISLCISIGWRAAKSAYERYEVEAEEAQRKEASRQALTPQQRLQALLGSREATEAFTNVYAQGQGHRAFASSESGAWGLRNGAGSADEAALDALGDCKRRLRPDSNGLCQLVHQDADWVVSPDR